MSLRLRVIISIIFLLLIIGGTFSFLTVRNIHELIEEVMWENYSSYARSFAAFSAKSFSDKDLNELQRHLDVAFAELDMLFVVAKDMDGKIFTKTGNIENYLPYEVHKNLFEDEFIQVQEIGTKPGGLFHSTGHTFLITTPVVLNDENIGTIQLAVSTASANQRLANISVYGFKMAVTVVALGTIILIFVDRKLKKNINRLIQITRSMATGDLSQRVEIKTGDEIEHLGESFNMMADAIKTHEEEIITTRKKYENLFEESVIPTFVFADGGRILDVNKAGESLTGYTKQKLLNISIEKIAKDPDRINKILEQLIQTGEYIRNFEHEIINKRGKTVVVENNAGPIFDENGTLISVISTFKDITQQKNLEKQVQQYTEQLEKIVEQRTTELNDEKNKLQLILDNVPNSFIMLDRNLRVQSVSAQFETLLNKKTNDVIGKVCALSNILYKSTDQCPSRKAMQTGQIQLREACISEPSGNDRFYEHMAIPIKRNSKIENIIEIITDVTERKRFEEQLIRTEKLSATGEMAAIIAHEVRNSLTSVNLILQCLVDSTGHERIDAKSLEVAISAVNRMESIVRQLLEFSKPSEIHFQTANLNELVEQCMAFCKYQFQRKQILLQPKLSPKIPSLVIDVERMREVIINLLLNAADAIEEKGIITVETGFQKLKSNLNDLNADKAMKLKEGQKVVAIRVTDTGMGISSENLKRIFEPFYTSKSQGTGLGLTMAKRAIEEHSGIIFANSNSGEGSTFNIYLPLLNH